MPDWESTREISREINALGGLIYAFLGVCVWEGFNLFVLFDLPVILRRIPVKLTIIPYFVTKLSIFLNLVCLLVVWLASQGKGGHKVNCFSVTWTAIVFNMLSVIAATSLVVIRTVTLSKNRAVSFSIGGLTVVTLAVLYIPALINHSGYTFTVNAATHKPAGLCTSAGVGENWKWYGAIYATGLVINFASAVFSTYAVITTNARLEERKRRSLKNVLSKNGMVFMYFIVALYIMLVTAQFLNLNGIFKYLFSVPCILLICVCSMRIVIHLQSYPQYGGAAFFPERTRHATSTGLSRASQSNTMASVDREKKISETSEIKKTTKDGEGAYYKHDNHSAEMPTTKDVTADTTQSVQLGVQAAPTISFLSPSSAARSK